MTTNRVLAENQFLQKMVYTGVRENATGALSHVWIPLDSEGNMLREAWWDVPLHYRAIPGNVYEFVVEKNEAGESKSFYSCNAKKHLGGRLIPQFVENWKDKDLVLQWNSSDKAAERAVKNRKALDKQRDSADSFDALLPLRKAYENANTSAQRAQIIAMAIQYIMTGKV